MNYAIMPEKLSQIINDDIQLIDIRDPYQFKQQHIRNFQNIPYSSFFTHLHTLSQSKMICLLCESGIKAKSLARQLRLKDYQAYYVEGGFNAFLSIPPQKYY